MFNGLDLVLGLCLVSTAIGGWRIGFVARVASWILMACGVLAALNFLPWIIGRAPNLDSSGRLVVVVITILAGGLLGQVLGILVGTRLENLVPKEGKWPLADQLAGGAAGVGGFLLAVWLVLPAAANVPGFPAQQIRTSEIAMALNDFAPAPPDATSTLQTLLGDSGFPAVFGDLAAAPDLGPAPENVKLSQETIDRVSLSTVKVEGTACRRTQSGSGFAVGPNLLVTNAHVVAGESDTQVIEPDGLRHNATVVYFDEKRDIALLRVPTYTRPSLPVEKAQIGEEGAVFGHPGGQDPLDIQPAKVSQNVTAEGRDLYNQANITRNVLILSATLRQGDSGGALVDVDGNVIGVAFAIAPDSATTAYALDVSELRAALDTPRRGAVDTGNCLQD